MKSPFRKSSQLPEPPDDGRTRCRMLQSFTFELGQSLRVQDVVRPPHALAEEWIRKGLAVAAPVGGVVEQSILKFGFTRAHANGFKLELQPSAGGGVNLHPASTRGDHGWRTQAGARLDAAWKKSADLKLKIAMSK